MGTDVSFDRALAAVADGDSIDWDAIERMSPDVASRQRVRSLRLLAEIGDLHRSTVDPLEQAAAAAAQPTAVQPKAPRPTSAADRRAAVHARRASRPDAAEAYTSMSDTMDDASGPKNAPRWGRYRLVDKVGSGGFGQVYRAWDADLEFEVAIKLLHAHIADGLAGDRLRQEGRALARIGQQNVVRVLGVEVHEGRAGLVMEFVRGQTLEEVVRTRGSFSAAEAVIIGEDVCSALSAVHRAGYLHRDVKAKNVMREQAGRIVLMDFGTGREEQPGRQTGSDLTGTPIYMAPEVLEGKPASTRSDVYSVGVLLFFLVSGSHPVQARGTSELKAAHRDGRRRYLSEFRSDVPARFVRVVERALAPKAEDRFPNAAALLEALKNLSYEDGDEKKPFLVWVRQWLTIASLTILILFGLGALASGAFNLTLGRSGFARESPLGWIGWGAKSCALPIFFLFVGWLGQAVLFAVWRVAISLSRRMRGIDEWVRLQLAPFRRDPSLVGALVFLFSAVALIAAWTSFLPLLDAMTFWADQAPASSLALLAPANADHHDRYRETFSVLTVATIAAWFLVARLAGGGQRRRRFAPGLVAGAAAVVCLEVASLSISYRLLRHNRFPVVQWGTEVCYVTGESQEQRLLFCPKRPSSRNQVVPRSAPLEWFNREASVFEAFATPQVGVQSQGTK
jgi:Protein kinase domain